MTGSKYYKSDHAEIYQKESQAHQGMETENVGSRTYAAAHMNLCTNSFNKKFNKLVTSKKLSRTRRLKA